MTGAGGGPCTVAAALLAATLLAASLAAPAAAAVCQETNNAYALFGTGMMSSTAAVPSPDGGYLGCFQLLPVHACISAWRRFAAIPLKMHCVACLQESSGRASTTHSRYVRGATHGTAWMGCTAVEMQRQRRSPTQQVVGCNRAFKAPAVLAGGRIVLHLWVRSLHRRLALACAALLLRHLLGLLRCHPATLVQHRQRALHRQPAVHAGALR